jgi:hypothetical protein
VLAVWEREDEREKGREQNNKDGDRERKGKKMYVQSLVLGTITESPHLRHCLMTERRVFSCHV